MTGLGLNNKQSSTAGNSQIGGLTADQAGRPVSSGGFPDDGARRMPSASDKVSAENLRQKTLKLRSKSGRTSTDLSGTRAYVNSFLGGTN